VAAGGGGLAYNASASISPYGKGLNVSRKTSSGSTQPHGAGNNDRFDY